MQKKKIIQIKPTKISHHWNSQRGSVETNPTRNQEVVGLIPGLAQQVKYPEGIAVAVVQAGVCSSDWIPGLGTSICCQCGSKKKKKKKKFPSQPFTETSMTYVFTLFKFAKFPSLDRTAILYLDKH